MLDVSRRATSNLNVLHGKLDQKKTIEQKNLSTLQTFRNFVDAKVETMNENFEKFTQDNKNQIEIQQKTIGIEIN